jgi:hypothetical protein
MKKLIILSAIAAGGLFYTNKANAQISIHLGINVPVRHVYVAPRPVVVEETPVYDEDGNIPADYSDDYYYLPEVEAYYSVPNHCYYYNNGSAWISAAFLPGAYRNYNWRTAVRYEVRSPRPYLHHDIYRSRWGGYAGNRNNWGHRFDNRFNGGGYTYRNHDNRNWGRGNENHNNWGNRSNQNDHNRGNWSNRSNRNDNHNQSNWNNHRSGNNNGQRFAQNRTGYGTRH